MKKLQQLALISVVLSALLSTNAMAQEMNDSKPRIDKPRFDKPQCDGPNCPMMNKNRMGNGPYSKHMKRSKHAKRDSVLSTIRYLSLTKEQKAALKELRNENRRELRALRKSVRGNASRSNAIVNAISKDGLDRELVMRDATAKFQEREARRLDHIEKALKILTPMQREELKKLLQNKMSNREPRMKNRPMGMRNAPMAQ